MKRLIIAIIFISGFGINALLAQPLVVSKCLNQKFPAAKNIKWMKNNNSWKADFLLGDRKTSAVFDAEGHWQYSQQEIKLEEIGVDEVKASIKKDFYNCKILSIIIMNGEGIGTGYHVEGICGSETKDRIYDYNGWPFPKI